MTSIDPRAQLGLAAAESGARAAVTYYYYYYATLWADTD
jgi:hypothetical protein